MMRTRWGDYWVLVSLLAPATVQGDSLSCSDQENTLGVQQEDILRKRQMRRYQIIAAEPFEPMARRMEEAYPDRFIFHSTKWEKFRDGTDSIQVGGFTPHNMIAGEHVLFLASFHSNDVTMSQFQVFIYLLQSFIESLTIVLPYYPVATMERVDEEGTVAAAATYAYMFSSLPNCGKPTRLIVYDLHTLQNRFYLNSNTIASLQTALPLLRQRILEDTNIDAVAFPDDGAAKRFGRWFQGNMDIVICRKTRQHEARTIEIQTGDVVGRQVIIVDDLVQTGGTLYKCCKALKDAGALGVSAFVSHAVFPNNSWRRFLRDGDWACFEKVWVTNSIPTTTTQLPVDGDVFEVLDLTQLIVNDLDFN